MSPVCERRCDQSLRRRGEPQFCAFPDAIPSCHSSPGREYHHATCLGRLAFCRGEGFMARRFLAALFSLLLVSMTSAAKVHYLAASDDLGRVVDYAHSLEAHPLAKDNLQK